MLDLAQLKKQVFRFGGLSFTPINQEGWVELSKVLQRRCQTIDHATRVVDRWLETEVTCPKPAELGSLASSVAADAAMDHPILSDPCPLCEPDGAFRYVQKMSKDGVIFDCAERCTCARGIHLAAMDARRAVEEEKHKRKSPISLTRIHKEEPA